jgi:hypothetical protein
VRLVEKKREEEATKFEEEGENENEDRSDNV